LVSDASLEHNPGIQAGLKLSSAEKRRLKDELERKRVRIALVTVWDNWDEDGDTVEITGAGFSQEFELRHRKQSFFVPIIPGSNVRIRAVKDGGGGNVTLGLQTVLGPVLLPPLGVGEIVEVPTP